MAPNHCPGCGESITNKDEPCPRCGYQKDPKFIKKLVLFSALFIVLGTLWLLFLTKDLGSS